MAPINIIDDSGGFPVIVGTVPSVTNLVIENSTFKNNSATGDGGAIFGPLGNLDVESSTFTQNTASFGGALALDSVFYNITVDYSGFYDNSASVDGGLFGIIIKGYGVLWQSLSGQSIKH